MAAVCEQELVQIVRGLPHDQYLVACGRFQTIELFQTLIDTIDQKASELDEHRRPPDPTDTDRSLLTFWGSPYWDAIRKRVPHFGNGNGTSS